MFAKVVPMTQKAKQIQTILALLGVEYSPETWVHRDAQHGLEKMNRAEVHALFMMVVTSIPDEEGYRSYPGSLFQDTEKNSGNANGRTQ